MEFARDATYGIVPCKPPPQAGFKAPPASLVAAGLAKPPPLRQQGSGALELQPSPPPLPPPLPQQGSGVLEAQPYGAGSYRAAPPPPLGYPPDVLQRVFAEAERLAVVH